MSQNNHYVAAIDIGTTKIVAIIGKKHADGKIEIIGMGNSPSYGVKRGVVLNIEETVNAIKKSVTQAQEQCGIPFKDVYVGIAGQHIKSLRNRGYINRDSFDDEIKKEDVQALIDDMYKIPIDAGEEIIHVLPQSFTVDNEIGVKSPVGMSGKRLEANFHIVIGQIAAANNLKKCVNRCGLNVNKLILEPLASSDAVLTDDEKEVGVALVDIGGGTTDVAVFYDSMIRHTAVIPFGGNIVTNDIKKGCSILERQAEGLKVKFGSALADASMRNKVVTINGISGRPPKEISFENLAHIVQARMEEIIAEIYFEIEASGVGDKLGAGIVITGGGALLKNLAQLISFKTGYEVRLGLPNQHLTSDIVEEINAPQFSTSVGLLLKGYEYEETEHIRKRIKMPQKAVEEDVEQEVTEKPAKKKKIINGFLDKFSELFEVDDSKM